MLTMTCSIDSGASLLKEFCHDLISSINQWRMGLRDQGRLGVRSPGSSSQKPTCCVALGQNLPARGLDWACSGSRRWEPGCPESFRAASAVGESVCSEAPSPGSNSCPTTLWLCLPAPSVSASVKWVIVRLQRETEGPLTGAGEQGLREGRCTTRVAGQ